MSMLRPSADFLRDFSAKVIEHRKERQGCRETKHELAQAEVRKALSGTCAGSPCIKE
jgi:hypothetical protein